MAAFERSVPSTVSSNDDIRPFGAYVSIIDESLLILLIFHLDEIRDITL